MPPLRLNIISCNLWNRERWDFRRAAVRKFLELFAPDIFCVQELVPISCALIDEVLSDHARVHDRLIGWHRESNIWWRESLFSEIEHGAEEVQITDSRHRRLFWVRLQSTTHDRSVLVCTAHMSHQRGSHELKTGESARVGESKRIIAALARLAQPREPVFFMGDFNDPAVAPTLLQRAGYPSSFAVLGLEPMPTFKCYPTAGVTPGKLPMSETIDWIVANKYARPLCTSVPRFFYEDSAPSDHWPVQAIYEVFSA